MIYKKARMFTKLLGTMLTEYAEYKKQYAPHRCKIVGIEPNSQTGQLKFLVKINSIKNQISIPYCPEELITNDSLLREFSQTDVRAITFYAIKNSRNPNSSNIENHYEIIGQEFLSGKTLFKFRKVNSSSECRMMAEELYANTDLLKQFNFNDLINIIYTAVQELTLEDVG